MGDAFELQVLRAGGAVVEEKDGAMPAGEELFELKDLAAVAQGRVGQHAHFGKRIEDDASGIDALDFVEDGLGGAVEFDFGGVEEGGFGGALQLGYFVAKFEKVEAVEGPLVGTRNHFHFLLGFGERDVEAGFADADSFEQELQGESRFADARIALEQVEAVRRKSAAENLVETWDTGAAERRRRGRGFHVG